MVFTVIRILLLSEHCFKLYTCINTFDFPFELMKQSNVVDYSHSTGKEEHGKMSSVWKALQLLIARVRI